VNLKKCQIETHKLLTVLGALEQLLVAGSEGLLVAPLEPGLDGLVLLVEVVHVRHQILDDVHVRQGVDLEGLGAGVGFARESKFFFKQEVECISL